MPPSSLVEVRAQGVQVDDGRRARAGRELGPGEDPPLPAQRDQLADALVVAT
jgi:hypothetical protein